MKPMTFGEWFKLVYTAQTSSEVDKRLVPSVRKNNLTLEEFDLIRAYANEVEARVERMKGDIKWLEKERVMNVIKVIVDEMPKGCGHCELSTDSDFGDVYCCATGEDISNQIRDTRPDWCPLMAGKFIPTQFDKRYHIIKESESE